MSATVGTPVQRGVGYEAGVALRFATAAGAKASATADAFQESDGVLVWTWGTKGDAANGKTVAYQEGSPEGGVEVTEDPSADVMVTFTAETTTANDVLAWLVAHPEFTAATADLGTGSDGTAVLQMISPYSVLFAGGSDWTPVYIPMASTFTLKEVANGVETEGYDGAVDNFGTGNHRLVCSGDFKVKSGSSVPNKGDLLYTEDHATEGTWVVSADPEVKGFSAATGAPLVVAMELMAFSEL